MMAVDTAALDALRAVLANVHDGEVPVDDADATVITATLPYVVYFSDIGYDVPETRKLGGPASSRETSFQVTYVGSTRQQAKWAGEKARAALADRHLAGGFVRCTDSARVALDDENTQLGGGPLFYGVDQYAVNRALTR